MKNWVCGTAKTSAWSDASSLPEVAVGGRVPEGIAAERHALSHSPGFVLGAPQNVGLACGRRKRPSCYSCPPKITVYFWSPHKSSCVSPLFGATWSVQLYLDRQVSPVALRHGDSRCCIFSFLYFKGVFAIRTNPRDPKHAPVISCCQQLEFLGLQVDPGIGSGWPVLERDLPEQRHVLAHAGIAVGVDAAHGAGDVADCKKR